MDATSSSNAKTTVATARHQPVNRPHPFDERWSQYCSSSSTCSDAVVDNNHRNDDPRDIGRNNHVQRVESSTAKRVSLDPTEMWQDQPDGAHDHERTAIAYPSNQYTAYSLGDTTNNTAKNCFYDLREGNAGDVVFDHHWPRAPCGMAYPGDYHQHLRNYIPRHIFHQPLPADSNMMLPDDSKNINDGGGRDEYDAIFPESDSDGKLDDEVDDEVDDEAVGDEDDTKLAHDSNSVIMCSDPLHHTHMLLGVASSPLQDGPFDSRNVGGDEISGDHSNGRSLSRYHFSDGFEDRRGTPLRDMFVRSRVQLAESIQRSHESRRCLEMHIRQRASLAYVLRDIEESSHQIVRHIVMKCDDRCESDFDSSSFSGDEVYVGDEDTTGSRTTICTPVIGSRQQVLNEIEGTHDDEDDNIQLLECL